MRKVEKARKKYAVSIHVYKCRRCDAIFSNSMEAWSEGLVFDMMNLSHLPDLEAEKEGNKELGIDGLSDKSILFEIHICEDGGRGLSDLIGCKSPREVIIAEGEWESHYREKLQERKFYNFGFGQCPPPD